MGVQLHTKNVQESNMDFVGTFLTFVEHRVLSNDFTSHTSLIFMLFGITTQAYMGKLSSTHMSKFTQKNKQGMLYLIFCSHCFFSQLKNNTKIFRKSDFTVFTITRAAPNLTFNFQTHVCLTSILWLCIAKTM